MSWLALTSAHIKVRLAEEELEAIESTGCGTGDRLAGIITQVTSLVRASVAACHKNLLGPADTIPEECLHAAATIAKHDIRVSLPTTGGDDDNKLRIEEYRNATGFLKSMARCEIGIENDGDGIAGRDTGCYGGDPKHDF